MIINILFYLFSAILLLRSLMVIIVQNSIYSVLFLVLSFISSSGILLLLKCEFLALMFLIIYVGAIAVLFLFVVMMLDLKTANLKKDTLKYFPFGVIIGGLLLIEIILGVKETFNINPYTNSVLTNWHFNWYERLDTFTEIQAIGQVVYTEYVLQFLIAGNVLLLATIAAVVLTLKTDVNTDRKQIIFRQLSRSYKNVLIV
jgi:NADH-quinone oxidoreductase subunit J